MSDDLDWYRKSHNVNYTPPPKKAVRTVKKTKKPDLDWYRRSHDPKYKESNPPKSVGKAKTKTKKPDLDWYRKSHDPNYKNPNPSKAAQRSGESWYSRTHSVTPKRNTGSKKNDPEAWAKTSRITDTAARWARRQKEGTYRGKYLGPDVFKGNMAMNRSWVKAGKPNPREFASRKK